MKNTVTGKDKLYCLESLRAIIGHLMRPPWKIPRFLKQRTGRVLESIIQNQRKNTVIKNHSRNTQDVSKDLNSRSL